MTYSIIGILAAVILLIMNRDVLWNQSGGAVSPVQRNYRRFLLGVLCYYITDALWGILEAQRLTAILFADTAIHFIAMVAAVMLWTRYVVSSYRISRATTASAGCFFTRGSFSSPLSSSSSRSISFIPSCSGLMRPAATTRERRGMSRSRSRFSCSR